MALLETPSRDLDLELPDFSLKNIDGRMVGTKEIKGPNGTLILFICNHCPYVKAVIERLVEDCRFLQNEGIGCAAIMPNDVKSYPEDSFENMKIFAKQHNFFFPYLIDETQEVAKAFGAVCTPDIFGFSKHELLEYRGRVDSAGAKPDDENTVRELREAMQQISRAGEGPERQYPSMGCSIKWKT